MGVGMGYVHAVVVVYESRAFTCIYKQRVWLIEHAHMYKYI